MARTTLLAVIVLSGCAEGVQHVPFPSLAEDELAFLVAIRGEALLGAQGPFVRDGGGAFGLPPILREFEPEQGELWWLAVDAPGLRSRVPLWDGRTLAGMALEVSEPACAGVRRQRGRRVVPLAADFVRSLLLAESEFAESSAPPPLNLSVPVDGDACSPGTPPPFERFGATPELLPPGTIVDGRALGETSDCDGHLRLGFLPDQGRAVVATQCGILVLDAGEPWSDDPRRYWSPAARTEQPDEEGAWILHTAALDVARSSRELVVLWVALTWKPNPREEGEQRLLRLTWTPAGFAEEELVGRFEPLALDSLGVNDGMLHAFGRRGALHLVTAPGEPVYAFALGALGGHRLRGVAGPRRRDDPWAFVRDDHALLFGMMPGPGDAEVPPMSIEPPPDAQVVGRPSGLVSVVRPDGGLDFVYLVEDRNLVRRTPDGERASVSFSVPDGFEVCASAVDVCGEPSLARLGGFVAGREPGEILLPAGDCAGAMNVRLDAGCAELVSFGGEAPAPLPAQSITGIGEGEAGLLLLGANGLLLRAPKF